MVRPICGLVSFKMKVSGVELGRALQTLPVVDRHGLGLKGDQPVTPEFLERPVHMDERQTRRVAEFGLRDRKWVAVIHRKADRLAAHVDLAHRAAGEGAANKVGPQLNALFGRKPGGLPDYKYSEAMIAFG